LRRWVGRPVRLKDGAPLVTDNGQHIVDVTGLQITDPLAI
jgi:ribose 5-phosphate isomerase A